jgi:transcription elongation GreA/GreB family factor
MAENQEVLTARRLIDLSNQAATQAGREHWDGVVHTLMRIREVADELEQAVIVQLKRRPV